MILQVEAYAFNRMRKKYSIAQSIKITTLADLLQQ